MIGKTATAKRWPRALALLLVLALALPAAAAPGTVADGGADKPTVTVTAVGVGGTHVEVGLNVSAVQADGAPCTTFRAAGAVLRFDPALLEPVQWDSDAPVALRDANGWSTAAALYAKGPDRLSGKTALAYRTETAGCLYLMAEAPQVLHDFSQPLPPTVPLTAGDPAQPVTTAEGLPVLAPAKEAPPDETEPAAKTLLPTDALDVPVEQAVVTRFRLKEGADLDEALASIDLVTGAAAEASPLYDASGAAYYPGAPADNPTAAGKSIPANLQLLRVRNGTTYFTGGGGADNLIPVIFYDWDGKTLLGSSLVNQTGKGLDEVIDAFTATVQDTANPTAYDATGKYPLNGKQGYTFSKWVDINPVDADGNEAYTSFGTGIMVSNAYNSTTIAEPVDFTVPKAEGLTRVMLQAAYVANEELNASFTGITSPSDHYYTVSAPDDDYLQFGESTNYQITLRVQRGHYAADGATWIPVPRVRKLGLRVGMQIAGASGTVYMLQKLENQDDVIATIAVNNQVSVVSVEVIDLCDDVLTGGTTNWAIGSVKRSNTQKLVPEDTAEQPGFIKLAGVGYFNDQCRMADLMGDTGDNIRNSASQSGAVAAAGNYTTADFNYNPVYNSASGAGARRRNALANILDMYQSLTPRRNLTWDEMQEAIKHGTVWDADTSCWTNDFNGNYVP